MTASGLHGIYAVFIPWNGFFERLDGLGRLPFSSGELSAEG